MKKIVFTFVTLFLITNLFAQDKEYTFSLENGNKLYWHDISQDGAIFITPGVIKIKNSNIELHKINSDFTKGFVTEIAYDDFIGKNPLGNHDPDAIKNHLNDIRDRLSENGKYLKWGTTLINGNDGSQKKYSFGKDKITGNVNDIFRFLSDTHYTYIGPKKGRKNQKKKYDNGDIYIFSRSNADLTTIEKQLIQPQLPLNKEKGEVTEWYLGEQFENHFNLVTKDNVNEQRTIDTNHLVSYNYTGESINTVSLTVNLEKHHLIASENNGASVFHDHNYGSFSLNNVYTDITTGNYYVYGLYSDRPKKKMISGKYLGVYVFKFDAKGKLVWKNKYSMEGSKAFKGSLKASQVRIDHYKLSNAQLGIVVDTEETSIIYNINTTNGEQIKKDEVNYKTKKAIALPYEATAINIERFKYLKKEFPKKYFNAEALSVIYLNAKIYEYLKNKNVDHKLFYSAKTLANGSVILVEFDIENRKLNFYKYD